MPVQLDRWDICGPLRWDKQKPVYPKPKVKSMVYGSGSRSKVAHHFTKLSFTPVLRLLAQMLRQK